MVKTYKSGLYYGTKLHDNLKDLKDRVDKNFASLLIVDGGIGQGKTTLGVHIADEYNKMNGLPVIDLTKKNSHQMAMGGKEFTQKLRICFEKKLPAIVYDEAGDFNKRGSLTRFNAMLNRTFETFRAFKILVILCLPNFNTLDQSLFDNQIPRLYLHLLGRSESYGNYSGYGLYRMLLLKSRMSKMKMKNYAYTLIRPNFRGHFLDLDPKRSKQLDKLSIDNKISILKKSEVDIEGLMGYHDISKKLSLSTDWVRRAVNKLKIKPKRVISRKKYFSADVIDILADHQDAPDEDIKGVV